MDDLDDWQSLIDMVPSEDIPLNELEHQSVLDGLKAILLEVRISNTFLARIVPNES